MLSSGPVAGLKGLMEAVILQSLEDLYCPAQRKESKEFFRGEGFEICAEIAGLNHVEQYRIQLLLRGNKYGRNALG